MKRFKISLAIVPILVAVAAVDLTWFRWFVSKRRSMFGFVPMGLDFGVVGMGSVLLVVGAHVAHRRGRVGAFASGFAFTGLMVLLIYGLLCSIAPASMGRLASWMYDVMGGNTIESIEPILRRFLPWVGLTYSQIIWGTIVLSVPQFLMATTGGVFFRAMTVYRGRKAPP